MSVLPYGSGNLRGDQHNSVKDSIRRLPLSYQRHLQTTIFLQHLPILNLKRQALTLIPWQPGYTNSHSNGLQGSWRRPARQQNWLVQPSVLEVSAACQKPLLHISVRLFLFITIL